MALSIDVYVASTYDPSTSQGVFVVHAYHKATKCLDIARCYPNQSANQCHILAIAFALYTFPTVKLTVYSSNQYVVDGFYQRINLSKNKSLWEKSLSLFKQHFNRQIIYLDKHHRNDRYTNAKQAAKKVLESAGA